MSKMSKLPRSKLPFASTSATVPFGEALRSASPIWAPPMRPSASAMCGAVNCFVFSAGNFEQPLPGHVASRKLENVKPESAPGMAARVVLSPGPSDASSNCESVQYESGGREDGGDVRSPESACRLRHGGRA
jgi:hypothetical protein